MKITRIKSNGKDGAVLYEGEPNMPKWDAGTFKRKWGVQFYAGSYMVNMEKEELDALLGFVTRYGGPRKESS